MRTPLCGPAPCMSVILQKPQMRMLERLCRLAGDGGGAALLGGWPRGGASLRLALAPRPRPCRPARPHRHHRRGPPLATAPRIAAKAVEGMQW